VFCQIYLAYVKNTKMWVYRKLPMKEYVIDIARLGS